MEKKFYTSKHRNSIKYLGTLSANKQSLYLPYHSGKKHGAFTLRFMIIAAMVFICCTTMMAQTLPLKTGDTEKYLHIPSPHWEDQIIYFIVTDRFMDEDSTNNDQGEGEYLKGNEGYWNGGDLKGITNKINYIKELGATGIWITPPVANQWWNPQHTGTGNHGYWASNFVEVDKHLGTLNDYKQLSATLHKNNMCLVQDVVVNHMGDFYSYNGPYNPNDITENFVRYKVAQPTQYPFNHNNAMDSADRSMAIFHFTPEFFDHSDTVKKRTYQFADLDDLNTSNPVVRDALRASYDFWIREVGVDGFRFDTPHMVEHDFWNDFIHSQDSIHPGVERYAAALGKKDFMTFGETAVQTLPYDNGGSNEAHRYTGTQSQPEMKSVLNFPLVSTIDRVFQERKPTDLLTYTLNNTAKIFEHPEWLLNFIDNHDGARFISETDRTSFQQALLFIMTIPGIPVIYYGTEQEFTGMRQAMFKGGVGSIDKDHFITDNASFKFVQHLIKLRKDNDLFRHGKLEVVRDDAYGPGVFAYQLTWKEQYALIIINTSNTPKIANDIHLSVQPGTSLSTRYAISLDTIECTANKWGNISLYVPAGTGAILFPDSKEKAATKTTNTISFDILKSHTITAESVLISGKASGLKQIMVTVDGNISKAIEVTVKEDHSWSVELPLNYMMNGKHHIDALYMPANSSKIISCNRMDFDLMLPIKLVADVTDNTGDDHGPNGHYSYPGHSSYSSQMDISNVKVYTIGTNLKIDITMNEITGIWLPPNGFDHALMNIYIDLPEKSGVKELPFQNAVMPEGCEWNYRVATAGFSNKLYTSEGASEYNLGKSVGPTAFVSTDKNKKMISFLIASEAMNYPVTLNGAKLYINTWDGDAESPRPLKKQNETWSFGGGNDGDPLIMDDCKLIQIRL